MTTTKIVRSSCGGLNSCRSSCYQRLSRSHDEQKWVIITSLALLIIVFIIFFIEQLLPFPGQSKVHKELRSQAGFQIVSWQSQARPRSSSSGVGASFPSRFDASSGLCMSKLQIKWNYLLYDLHVYSWHSRFGREKSKRFVGHVGVDLPMCR